MTILAICTPALALLLVSLYGWYEHSLIAKAQSLEAKSSPKPEQPPVVEKEGLSFARGTYIIRPIDPAKIRAKRRLKSASQIREYTVR